MVKIRKRRFALQLLNCAAKTYSSTGLLHWDFHQDYEFEKNHTMRGFRDLYHLGHEVSLVKSVTLIGFSL